MGGYSGEARLLDFPSMEFGQSATPSEFETTRSCLALLGLALLRSDRKEGAWDIHLSCRKRPLAEPSASSAFIL